jgi:hypothetical protein
MGERQGLRRSASHPCTYVPPRRTPREPEALVWGMSGEDWVSEVGGADEGFLAWNLLSERVGVSEVLGTWWWRGLNEQDAVAVLHSIVSVVTWECQHVGRYSISRELIE